jgi:L-asparagine transporter-like permease
LRCGQADPDTHVKLKKKILSLPLILWSLSEVFMSQWHDIFQSIIVVLQAQVSSPSSKLKSCHCSRHSSIAHGSAPRVLTRWVRTPSSVHVLSSLHLSSEVSLPSDVHMPASSDVFMPSNVYPFTLQSVYAIYSYLPICIYLSL